jgi:hypothetical protein
MGKGVRTMRELRDARWRQVPRMAAGFALLAGLMLLPKAGYEHLYLPGLALLMATYLISVGMLSLCYPMAAFDGAAVFIRRGSLLRPSMLRVKREAVAEADVWNFRHVELRGGGKSGGRARTVGRPHFAVRLQNGRYVVADRIEGDGGGVLPARRFAEALAPAPENGADCAVERRTLWPMVALRALLPLGVAALMWLRWRAL